MNEISKSPDVSYRAAVNAWNQAVRPLPDWPRIELALPNRQKVVKLPDETFPQSLHADLERLAETLTRPNPFDAEGRPKPVRPATILQYRRQLLRSGLYSSVWTPSIRQSKIDSYNEEESTNMLARDSLLLSTGSVKAGAIIADPAWQFNNRTGKIAPEHKRLHRYPTMTFQEIKALPVPDLVGERAHLYLWSPNALLAEALAVMAAWDFEYKTMLIWHKVRKDGGSDGRGCGFYFRNVTECVLFGVRGKSARTLQPGRSQVNLIASQKREHSRKPDELYDLSKRAARGHTSSSLRAMSVLVGRAGATRSVT